MPNALVDNDIVEKLSRWSAADCLAPALDLAASRIGYLATLRFVVGKRLNRVAAPGVQETFERFLAEASELEASDEEIAVAASIEDAALACQLDVDPGESLLLAVALSRDVPKLITGDKRAVCSCHPLSQAFEAIEPLRGRLISLEQVLAKLLVHSSLEDLREQVCSDPCDKTARSCFACSSDNAAMPGVLAALASYQKDLAVKSNNFTSVDLLG